MERIYDMVQSHTMVCEDGVEFLTEAVRWAKAGALVECGTWRGGCALAMLLQQQRTGGRQRPVHLFDSFKGLPPAEPRDGPAALKWQAETKDNCRATREELVHLMTAHGFVEGRDYHVHAGWFSETLHDFREPIALLRLDCDWYASVRQCLELMVPHCVSGATVIIDDYYAWDGCARAVHDYLSSQDVPWRIRTIGDGTGAYFEVTR